MWPVYLVWRAACLCSLRSFILSSTAGTGCSLIHAELTSQSRAGFDAEPYMKQDVLLPKGMSSSAMGALAPCMPP